MKSKNKFRGRRLDNGEWVYGYLADVMIGVDGYEDRAIIIPIGTALGIACDPNSVGQFIGLLDMFGTEIYEGDILKYKDHPISDWSGVVEYRHAGFYITPNGSEYILNEQRTSQTQVVGNINDNPELLKTKQS